MVDGRMVSSSGLYSFMATRIVFGIEILKPGLYVFIVAFVVQAPCKNKKGTIDKNDCMNGFKLDK